MPQKFYLCIDLKSFYASVECVERGLDPMTTNLVVADPDRTDKTICLAVSPSMKALGIHNRCRVFEIPKNIDYIMATPRMQKYIDYSANIYAIYLKYISKEDIHVYSIDEAFMDVTAYLDIYKLTPKELASKIMNDIYTNIGVRATCGIGTNLYLTKIALDIMAKHSSDFIGYLDEESYRTILWDHQPLTDFWRIGKGIAERLAWCSINTMRELANADEELLYKEFGIDAELLIDHAWGREPTTIADIKAYKPKTNCLSSGQVLARDYKFDEGSVIVQEMMDLLCLDMVDKELVTNSISIYIGYSNSLKSSPAKGTVSFKRPTSSDKVLIPAVASLYNKIVDHKKTIRRVNITCNNIKHESEVEPEALQLSLFESTIVDEHELERDKKRQQAILDIKRRFGKNAILKGLNYMEGATTRERNRQIGGHRSGE